LDERAGRELLGIGRGLILGAHHAGQAGQQDENDE
jgi:hypothetical protein